MLQNGLNNPVYFCTAQVDGKREQANPSSALPDHGPNSGSCWPVPIMEFTFAYNGVHITTEPHRAWQLHQRNRPAVLLPKRGVVLLPRAPLISGEHSPQKTASPDQCTPSGRQLLVWSILGSDTWYQGEVASERFLY